jgi:RNA polymerase sigma-70 factor (ECF subfamily)
MMADADPGLRRAARTPTLGRYRIEAAIAAARADRRNGRPIDWPAILGLCRGLVARHPATGVLTGLAAAPGEAGDPGRGARGSG